MENPRGVSSSLPGHMCTVVLFININIIIINLSIKSPFSYREDSWYLIITMTIYQNIMISTFQGPCETLPGQTNFTCKVSLLQRTWFVLSYLARYIYMCAMDTHFLNITYKRILIVIQSLYNKRAVHFSQIGVQPGRFACSQEVALRRTQVVLPLHLPLPDRQYLY